MVGVITSLFVSLVLSPLVPPPRGSPRRQSVSRPKMVSPPKFRSWYPLWRNWRERRVRDYGTFTYSGWLSLSIGWSFPQAYCQISLVGGPPSWFRLHLLAIPSYLFLISLVLWGKRWVQGKKKGSKFTTLRVGFVFLCVLSSRWHNNDHCSKVYMRVDLGFKTPTDGSREKYILSYLFPSPPVLLTVFYSYRRYQRGRHQKVLRPRLLVAKENKALVK